MVSPEPRTPSRSRSRVATPPAGLLPAATCRSIRSRERARAAPRRVLVSGCDRAPRPASSFGRGLFHRRAPSTGDGGYNSPVRGEASAIVHETQALLGTRGLVAPRLALRRLRGRGADLRRVAARRPPARAASSRARARQRRRPLLAAHA